MDFIINNYLWFGIAGVVLLMALIGFLAEKTNFISGGANNTTEKFSKQNKNNKTEKLEQPVTTVNDEIVEPTTQDPTPSADEVLDFSQITSNSVEPTIDSAPLPVDDMWNQLSEELETSSNNEVMEQTMNSVITETGEDLSQPFGDLSLQEETNDSSNQPGMENPTPSSETEEDLWKF